MQFSFQQTPAEASISSEQIVFLSLARLLNHRRTPKTVSQRSPRSWQRPRENLEDESHYRWIVLERNTLLDRRRIAWWRRRRWITSGGQQRIAGRGDRTNRHRCGIWIDELWRWHRGSLLPCCKRSNERNVRQWLTMLSNSLINIFTVLMNMTENLREHHGV